jgi:hypothetical protein
MQNINVKVDEMNLHDYVMESFDRICDLTPGRINSLNFILGNVSGKFVNVGLFKAVFKVNNFEEIVKVLTDMDRFDEMHTFGLLCRREVEKEVSTASAIGSTLIK